MSPNIGYFIGALLSGVAGYVGMLISVKANVRTAEAARHSLQSGLTIAFKSGAITGLLVAGLALISITFYYIILINLNVDSREIINALVALGFGASLISILCQFLFFNLVSVPNLLLYFPFSVSNLLLEFGFCAKFL